MRFASQYTRLAEWRTACAGQRAQKKTSEGLFLVGSCLRQIWEHLLFESILFVFLNHIFPRICAGIGLSRQFTRYLMENIPQDNFSSLQWNLFCPHIESKETHFWSITWLWPTLGATGIVDKNIT